MHVLSLDTQSAVVLAPLDCRNSTCGSLAHLFVAAVAAPAAPAFAAGAGTPLRLKTTANFHSSSGW